MTQDSKSNLTGPTPSAPNSVSSLADRLKAKTAQEAAAIQSATQNELALHQQHLRDLSTNVVNSTVAAIESSVTKAAWSLEESGKEAETALKQTTELMRSSSQQVTQELTVLQTDLHSKGEKMRAELDEASESLSERLKGVDGAVKQTQGRFVKAAKATADAVDEQQSEVREAVQKQTQQLIWLMKIPMLIVLGFCLLACAGVWGWTAYRMNQAEERETLAQMKVDQIQTRINQLTQEFCATPAGRKSCTSPKK